MKRYDAYERAVWKIEKARLMAMREVDLSQSKIGAGDALLDSIPDSMSQLSRLQRLNVSGNALRDFPGSIRGLNQLQALDLSYNLIGLLPEWIGEFSGLQSIKIAKNNIKKIPFSFWKLNKIWNVDFSGNRICEISDGIGNLRNLRSLNLSGNKISVLPRRFSELSSLQSVNISANILGLFPEEICSLSDLRSINLSENKISEIPDKIGNLSKVQYLNLSSNYINKIPDSIVRMVSLKTLNLSKNDLEDLPVALTGLKSLETLNLSGNKLKSLPDSFGNLSNLEVLRISNTSLEKIPDSIRNLKKLRVLWLDYCEIRVLPEWLSELSNITDFIVRGNEISEIPASLSEFVFRCESGFRIDNNPLGPELQAAYNNGRLAVVSYLRETAKSRIWLDEAKLIIVGEGEVGKSCLLSALRGEPWVENRTTTHGIEIKPLTVRSKKADRPITLNCWDFGGQRVYRPTHQLFFSAPAIYLVVWKPREGAQQGQVKEWIQLVKHREPDARIIVVATHGGPSERQPDLDRQDLWDFFGKETIVGFTTVESRPDSDTGETIGIDCLIEMIGEVAVDLPGVGRIYPLSWNNVRKKLSSLDAAWIEFKDAVKICNENNIDEENARILIRIFHLIGDLIHYEHDPVLRDIVVLKPNWLATAISYVLDDKATREMRGLAKFTHLGVLWNDDRRPLEFRYHRDLHPIFVKLMERYDLSYRVSIPEGELRVCQENDPLYLIAQLVPDIRPEIKEYWPDSPRDFDIQQTQICRIVDADNGQSVVAEGIFFQLIVRLHRYSMGRNDFRKNLHWQRGVVLEDSYNGMALLEHVGNDVKVTVRAPYPQHFIGVLTSEVKWLVENFWRGIRCHVMIPCVKPCGLGIPGTGLFEIKKLVEAKKRGMQNYPCHACDEWQEIDGLMVNSAKVIRQSDENLLLELSEIKECIHRNGLSVEEVRTEISAILSKLDEAHRRFIIAMSDEAKNGPRMFTFTPVDPGFLDKPKWVSAKFRITLWCEHSKLPLPLLCPDDPSRGVYLVDIPRSWLVRSAPFLKLLGSAMSMVVPLVGPLVRLELDEGTYKNIEEQLDLGQKSVESIVKGAADAGEWAASSEVPEVDCNDPEKLHGAALRQMHAWLIDKDPGFGGLVQVVNNKNEFLWVHEKFENLY